MMNMGGREIVSVKKVKKTRRICAKTKSENRICKTVLATGIASGGSAALFLAASAERGYAAIGGEALGAALLVAASIWYVVKLWEK